MDRMLVMQRSAEILKICVVLSIVVLFTGCGSGGGGNGNGNSPPVADFVIIPTSGTINTNFQFDASNCSDDQDPPSLLEVRWDFEGDGDWTSWPTNKIIDHQYSSEGTKTVKLEVKDTGGLIGRTQKNLTVSSQGISYEFLTKL